jgi:hypothetical protein
LQHFGTSLGHACFAGLIARGFGPGNPHLLEAAPKYNRLLEASINHYFSRNITSNDNIINLLDHFNMPVGMVLPK